MKFHHQAHVVYTTQYHIVWIPKFRRKVLIPGVKQYFEKVMDSYLIDRYPDVLLLKRSVQPDHIHLLLEIPPKYSVSQIVGAIKANTSRVMRKKFPYLANSREMWSIGFFVSTVGLNAQLIRKYIENQETQDKGQAELEFHEDTAGGAERSP